VSWWSRRLCTESLASRPDWLAMALYIYSQTKEPLPHTERFSVAEMARPWNVHTKRVAVIYSGQPGSKFSNLPGQCPRAVPHISSSGTKMVFFMNQHFLMHQKSCKYKINFCTDKDYQTLALRFFFKNLCISNRYMNT
jgi:hypothetical protein